MAPEAVTNPSGTSARSLSPLHWTGLALALSTGIVHLWLGLADAKPPLAVAGVGFLVGIGAVLSNSRRRTVARLGIPFTGGQILLYGIGHGFLTRAPLDFTAVQLADKAAQIALLVVLVVLVRRAE